jgi:hypothetical protein
MLRQQLGLRLHDVPGLRLKVRRDVGMELLALAAQQCRVRHVADQSMFE